MNMPLSHDAYGSIRKIKWLIRREWWEHRVSFFWGPMIAGGISSLISALVLIAAQILLGKNHDLEGKFLNGIDLSDFTRNQLSAEDMQKLSDAITIGSLSAALWPMIIFGFTVFFYLLGALYDDRRDRSILFWKSLPVSDTQTVLSKVICALWVAPLGAVTAAFLTILMHGLLFSVFILINGGNPLTLYWFNINPVTLIGALLGWIPIYTLWSLPTIGWLLLCSAWMRSVPFLWSILIPILSGIALSISLRTFNLPVLWFWEHVVARLLASAWPGAHLLGYRSLGGFEAALGSIDSSPASIIHIDGILGGHHLLLTPSLWLGALAGIVMIFIAIRLRRWRTEI